MPAVPVFTGAIWNKQRPTSRRPVLTQWDDGRVEAINQISGEFS